MCRELNLDYQSILFCIYEDQNSLKAKKRAVQIGRPLENLVSQ